MRYQQWEQERGSPELARELRHVEQQDRDAEAYERGAAEKPMAEQAVALCDDYVIELAVGLCLRNEQWRCSLLTDIDSAIQTLEEAIISEARCYDQDNA